jgi:hypothetical protein
MVFKEVDYDLAVRLRGKAVAPLKARPELFVVVYLAVVLQHEPAVAAGKRLRTARAAHYGEPGVAHHALRLDAPQFQVLHRLGAHHHAVARNSGTIRPAVCHANKHAAHERSDVFTIFAHYACYSTHFLLIKTWHSQVRKKLPQNDLKEFVKDFSATFIYEEYWSSPPSDSRYAAWQSLHWLPTKLLSSSSCLQLVHFLAMAFYRAKEPADKCLRQYPYKRVAQN